jgi:hypothetical protein
MSAGPKTNSLVPAIASCQVIAYSVENAEGSIVRRFSASHAWPRSGRAVAGMKTGRCSPSPARQRRQ